VSAAGPYSIGAERWNGLSKLIEECGEVMQVAGKIIGNGGGELHWDGSVLPDRLLLELGDLQAAIMFLLSHYDYVLAESKVALRVQKKIALFEEWNASQH
jgi:NTP pyrophosphatase (non-canonical NTP hydrolase)